MSILEPPLPGREAGVRAAEALAGASRATSRVALQSFARARAFRPDRPAAGWSRLLRASGEALGSQILLGTVSLLSLPLLAHNLGPERYGAFSLFVALLGTVSCQDFVRPLLVRERIVAQRRGGHELGVLASTSTSLLGLLAAGVGLAFLEPLEAAPFALAVVFHGMGSLDYAELAARGRIGTATAIRNGAWAAALAAVVVLSFGGPRAGAYAWPFVAANLLTWASYRWIAGPRALARAMRTGPRALARAMRTGPRALARAMRTGPRALARAMRTGPRARARAGAGWLTSLHSALGHHSGALRDLLGFNLALLVITSSDRALLRHFAPPAEAGLYLAALDLALKLGVIGSVLGTVLYPMLASDLEAHGPERSAARFVSLCRRILVGFFFVVLASMLADRALVALVLGPAFESAHGLFSLALLGVFVHMLGYLITPWQRVRGDFASQRRAYGSSAILMVAVGLALIPPFGARGAIVAFLCGRSAELMLLAGELRRSPPGMLPRRSLAALTGMVAVLLVTALARAGAGTP